MFLKKFAFFRYQYLFYSFSLPNSVNLPASQSSQRAFTYTVTIRFNEFKRYRLHVGSVLIVTHIFGYCGGFRAVSLFVNRSAMFVEAVFNSTLGFSYVLFVTVVHNIFGVAVNVKINSLAGRIKCILKWIIKSVVYVIACQAVVATTEKAARFVSSGRES